ncbi:MAG: TlpA disulfide reductase family protein, partial [Planctomycetota bacterium]|nr:TlpA disulfide reductase family protein [Planctomycetota bacterium]
RAALLALLAGAASAQTQDIAPPPVKPAPIADPAAGTPKKAEEKITLKVGDAAPAIAVEKWVKGDEIKAFEKGKIYVVEFWATWCGPCIQSIPHLTELARDHKDVTFIGVAASERKEDDGSDKRLDKLKAFVTKQGAKMGYTVAYDADRKMGTPWLKASGQKGIPAAFIVNGEGKIAWIGHPMDLDSNLADAIKANKSGKGKNTKTTTKDKATKDKTSKPAPTTDGTKTTEPTKSKG